MSAVAQLKALLGLDTSDYEKSMTAVTQKTENFSNKFQHQLRETKSAVKDVSGSIEGIGRAFDGSVGGAVSGLRELMGLLVVSPWAALGTAAAGALVGIAKYAENAADAVANKLGKEIAKFIQTGKEIESIRAKIKEVEADREKPKETGTELVDYSNKQVEAAQKEYDQAVKTNEAIAERSKLIRAARADMEQYAKSMGISVEAAKQRFAPTEPDITGASVSAQKSRLASMGYGKYSNDIIEEAANGTGAAEQSQRESIKRIEEKRLALLKAEDDKADADKKYADLRKKQADEDLKNADKRDEEASKKELDRITKQVEKHNERVKKWQEGEEKKRKAKEETIKAEDDARESEMRVNSEAKRDIEDVYKKDRRSIFDNTDDQYQKIGGRIGGRIDMSGISRADKAEQVQQDIKKITDKQARDIEQIRQKLDVALDQIGN